MEAAVVPVCIPVKLDPTMDTDEVPMVVVEEDPAAEPSIVVEPDTATVVDAPGADEDVETLSGLADCSVGLEIAEEAEFDVGELVTVVSMVDCVVVGVFGGGEVAVAQVVGKPLSS